jgi:hypothetical protein
VAGSTVASVVSAWPVAARTLVSSLLLRAPTSRLAAAGTGMVIGTARSP